MKNNKFLIIFSIITIYTIIGFVAIPKLFKPQIEKIINEHLTQKISIEKIDFNPFLFKLSAYNLKIYDKEETTFFAEKIYIDFSVLKSLHERHINFEAFEITKPFVHIIEYENGSFNLEKLVKQTDIKQEEKNTESNIKFQILKTALIDGKIKFTKLQNNKKSFGLNLDKINYTFYNMGTFENILASHNLDVLVNKHTKLIIKGGLRLEPFKMYGKTELKNLKPAELLAYKQDIFNFNLDKKTLLNLEFGYNIDTSANLKLEIENANLKLQNLNLIQDKNNILSLKTLDIDNFNLTYPQNNIEVTSLYFDKLNSKIINTEDGKINFSTLLINKEDEKNSQKDTKKDEKYTPWKVSIDKLKIKDSNIVYNDLKEKLFVDNKNINLDLIKFKLIGEDYSLKKASLSKPTIIIKDDKNNFDIINKELELTLNNLNSKEALINLNNANLKLAKIDFKDKKNNLDILNEKIELILNNLNSKETLINLNDANLKLAKIDFKDKKNNLDILSQNIIFTTQALNLNKQDLQLEKVKLKTPILKVDDNKNKIDIVTKNINIILTKISLIKEKLNINILALTKPTIYLEDKKNNQSIVAKDISLKINNIENFKNSIKIAKINLNEPNISLEDKKNKTNITAKNIYVNINKISHENNKLKINNSTIVKPIIEVILEKKMEKKEKKPKLAKSSSKKEKSNFQFDIGPVKIKDMQMSFEDKNLPIPFKTDITKLNGNFSRLNSNSSKPTKLELEGKVGEYGYTKITGKVDINDIKLLTNTNLLFKNLDIKNLTPYSGKFVGREIEKGRLDLDLKYNIKSSNLKAENSIIIRNIKLGKKVESSDAVDLPLDLAITLLEDTNGVIDIELPVKGNIDNPEFSIGHIVWQSFINLIAKAITAPFSLLASVFGFNPDELKSLEFEFGKSEILASEKETLENISKILTKKQKLAIVIKPSFDPINDKLALQYLKIEEILKQKAQKKGERQKILEKLYKKLNKVKEIKEIKKEFTGTNEKGEEVLNKDAYIEQLKQTLATKQEVTKEELIEVTKQRISNVNDYLIKEKNIPKESIKIEDIKELTTQKAKWTVFDLNITTKK